MTHEERRKVWRDRVAEFHASGESVAAWCRTQDLKEHQLRYWLRRVDAQSQSEPMTSWLALAVQGGSPPVSDTGVWVHAGGAAIEVRRGFDPDLLVDVVRALTAPC